MEPFITLHKLGFKDVYYRGHFKGHAIYMASFRGKRYLGSSETLIALGKNDTSKLPKIIKKTKAKKIRKIEPNCFH